VSALGPLIGTWRTEGEMLGDDGETVVATVLGTDAYEWLGTAFVVHRIDVRMGDQPVAGLEMIGPCLPDAVSFPTQAFDGEGGIESSTATVADDGTLTFGSDGARAHIRPGGDGTMTAAWERTPDGGATWVPWLRLRFTLLTDGSRP